MNTTNSAFNPRAFTVLLMTACAVALPVTGYENHSLGFEPMTVSRHAWMSAHNAVGVLFIVCAAWHVALNRRALLYHIRGAGAALSAPSRGALVGCILVALFLVLLVGHAFLVPSPPGQ
jgi:hypothetical protein